MKWWQHLHYRKCWQKCSWTTGCGCKKSTKTDLICNVLFCQLLSASEHSNNTITLPLKRKSSLLNKCILINIIWYRRVLFFLMSMKCLLQKPFLTARTCICLVQNVMTFVYMVTNRPTNQFLSEWVNHENQ